MRKGARQRLAALFTQACRDKQAAIRRLHLGLQELMKDEARPEGIRESVTEEVFGAMEQLTEALFTWQALEPLMEGEPSVPA